jgi:methyltransferase (TIGR00027 family)
VSVPTGIGSTALGVARFRAEETRRPDRLYADPLADAFLEAAGDVDIDDFVRVIEESGIAAHVVLRTRFFDDVVLAACGNGCRQVVVLGAGLDTRAHRLALPAASRVFELDLPELFAFKEPVLAGRAGAGGADRVVVQADLEGDWAAALAAAGHESSRATVWIMEGLVPFFTADMMDRLFAAIGDQSARGSVLAFDHVDKAFRALPEQGDFHGVVGQLAGGFRSHLVDPGAWLHERGWAATVRTGAEVARHYCRPFPAIYDPDVPGPCAGIWVVHAAFRAG